MPATTRCAGRAVRPVGGLPAQVRIDRGKDFRSNVVADALGAFAGRRWLVGRAGTPARTRYIPHQELEIEVFDVPRAQEDTITSRYPPHL